MPAARASDGRTDSANVEREAPLVEMPPAIEPGGPPDRVSE